jgi:hypothetical protein
MFARFRHHAYDLVGIIRQRPVRSLAPEAAFASPCPFGLVLVFAFVALESFGRRYAGIAGILRRLVQSRLKLGNAFILCLNIGASSVSTCFISRRIICFESPREQLSRSLLRVILSLNHDRFLMSSGVSSYPVGMLEVFMALFSVLTKESAYMLQLLPGLLIWLAIVIYGLLSANYDTASAEK